jgi:hypothetical protein
MTWVTNDPEWAAKLKAADARYEAAKLAASSLCLADKVSALRAAKHERAEAYRAIIETEA